MPATNATPEWYVFRVRPRHEKAVASQLREKDQHCFLPLLSQKRSWGKRSANVDLPLFPGYVFCEAERFGLLPILQTAGVIDVVRAGSSPAPVDRDELNAIKRVIEMDVQIEPCHYLTVGQKVRILEGPFSGLSGCLTDVRNTRRLILSITLLQRSVSVEVDAAAVVPLHQPYRYSEFVPRNRTIESAFLIVNE